MIHTNGMSTTKPWAELGNAYTWGRYNAHITDQTPAVGSVAWWDQDKALGGTSGHVAYVERVVSADEIWVSEDSSGGDFGWRKVTKTNNDWPSGFIHFRDLPAWANQPTGLRAASKDVATGRLGLTWDAPIAGPVAAYEVTWSVAGGASKTTKVTQPGIVLDGIGPQQRAAVSIKVLGAGSVPTGGVINASVSLTPFFDVDLAHAFGPEIAWLASSAITTGYPDGSFQPAQPVLREQMAAFLYRQAGRPAFDPPPVSPFADIATDHVFYREITWLTAAGISTGYAEPDGTVTYRPAEPVLREQMAAFLHRVTGAPPPVQPTSSPFADVALDHPFAGHIGWLAGTGVTTGYAEPDGSRTYRGAAPVLREQMAAFLYRFDRLP
jgi:surface antigen